MIKRLVDSYIKWLSDNISLKKVGDYTEITTPFLDNHNDWISIYVLPLKDGQYIITDDGYSINNLESSGVRIKKQREKLLNNFLRGYGACYNDKTKEIFVNTNESSFPQKKHNLIQAILSVNDMFMLSSNNAKSLFFEDVAEWFDKNDIRYTARVNFTGKSQYNHTFDFVLPKSKPYKQPERILKLINGLNNDNIKSTIFSFFDTQQTRSEDTKSMVLINDLQTNDCKIKEAKEALLEYKITPYVWSNKDAKLDAKLELFR